MRPMPWPRESITVNLRGQHDFFPDGGHTMLEDAALLVAFLCMGFAIGALVTFGVAYDRGFREGETHGRRLSGLGLDWTEEALR